MADRATWRKNLPEDFEGRHGEHWDDEVKLAPILWSSVAVVVSVVVAFAFCWWLITLFDGFQDEPQFSPIAEANERRLPPSPWLQPKPEVELDDMRTELEERLAGYGWSDQLEGLVHIPVDQAKEIVLTEAGAAPVAVEPPRDQPVDVETGEIPPATENPAARSLEADGGSDPTRVDPTGVDPTLIDPIITDPSDVDPADINPAGTAPDATDPAGTIEGAGTGDEDS